ncbi:protein lethal(2)essential for life-like isoform X2 [Belonocnema kinseyi]|uniref:protein lethal(2)essential for life-like isoform X2 n=1 Tax=Belonocnema kinseyi TaxID=2817044 RepID=UPI00143CDAD0|nr:protein lethal(2)essential for life-like isoform X2 [Belonocnema kinseyi]
MSLVPLLFSDWWEDLERPHRLVDQNFGLGLHRDQLLAPELLEQYIAPRIERRSRNPSMIYLRPWGELLRKGEGGSSTVKADKDQFQTSLDIQHFMPEEITVKVVNRFVVVEGEHSEKQDEHGWISRRFSRKYPVPEQYDLEEVQSNLSSDGVLTITIPRKYDPKHHREKPVKIEVTGKPVAREILEA